MSIFMTSLELILSKIPDADQRRAAGTAQNRNGSRAKNFLPPNPLHFLPARQNSWQLLTRKFTFANI